MQGVLLRLAYEGSAFAGWQDQPGQRTAQGLLKEALGQIHGRETAVWGASRTDAGVHALAQLASFDSPFDWPGAAWLACLNRRLPEDIAVHAASPCAAGYNPRFDARAKRYRYLVKVGRMRDPLYRDRAWQPGPVYRRQGRRVRELGERVEEWFDIEAMQRACTYLLGRHDFAAFQGRGDYRTQTYRTLFELRLYVGYASDPGLLAIEVLGDAFLKNMVRILAGTLIEVGCGKRSAESLAALLGEEARRESAGITAPPQGLYLVNIDLGRIAAQAPKVSPA